MLGAAQLVIKLVLGIHLDRYEHIFKKNMGPLERKNLLKILQEAHNENRLIVKMSSQGHLEYFIHFKKTFMGEFEENFFHVISCYCDKKVGLRRNFYMAILDAAKSMKKKEKVKRMCIEVSYDDILSENYFLKSKKGILTGIELVGNTREGLKILEELTPAKSPFKKAKMKKTM